MTALQELIEILNESQKFINDNDSKEDKYYRRGLREAIEEANKLLEKEKQMYSEEYNNTNLDKFLFPELIEEFAKYYEKIPLIENIKQETYSKQQTFELMKQAFEAGFKKADIVEAGLEPKETEQEINWILTKFKNK